MGRLKCAATVLAALIAALAFAVPAHANGGDNFADATDLTDPLNPYPADFGPFGSSDEPGEPNHAGNSAAASVWYGWRPQFSESVTLETCRPAGPDTVLAIYTGTALANLVEAGSDHDACGIGSRFKLAVTAGTQYWIAVDRATGGGGGSTYELSISPTPDNDDFAVATDLGSSAPVSSGAQSNTGATEETGEPQHAGVSGGASVWYEWTAPATGAYTANTCDTTGLNFPFDTALAVYQGASVSTLGAAIASDDNGCGGLSSRLKFAATGGQTYMIAVDGSDALVPGGALGDFNLQLIAAPANDDLADAEALPGALPVSASGSNAGATAEANETAHAGVSPAFSVWYEWTPAISQTVSIDTCGSSFDTRIGVYTGSGHPLTEIASNEDACGSASRVTLAVSSSTTYLIAVDGAPEGSFGLHVELPDTTPPAVPTINGSSPAGPADDNSPEISGTAEAGSTVRLYTTAGCTGTPAAVGSAAQFASPGLTVSVADNTVTELRATATDASANVSTCSAPLTYTEQSAGGPGPDVTPPQTQIDAAPTKVKVKRKKAKVTFRFSANEAGAHFECRLDGAAFAACASPLSVKAKTGRHTFEVRAIDAAGNADATPATAEFKVKRKRRR